MGKNKIGTSDNFSFTREDTKIVKGFAILLMLMHHLWPFPDRIAGGELHSLFGISGESLVYIFGYFGRICVSLFFLLGGYGIYLQSKKQGFSILKSIKRLYLAYWKVFVVFIPIAFLLFAHQGQYCENSGIWAIYGDFKWSEIIKNFFGVSSTLNGEWWFLASYVVAIITFPFWKYIFEKISVYKGILIVIAVNLLMTYVLPALGNIPELGYLNNSYLYRTFLCQQGCFYSCFLIGIMFAQNDWFNKIRLLLREHFQINLSTSFIALISIVFIRHYTALESLDILFAPAVTICVIEITRRLPIVARALSALGHHSTTIWLTHSYWCYYFYPFVKIVVWSRWAVPSYIILVTMSYIAACCFDYIWARISSSYSLFLAKNQLPKK